MNAGADGLGAPSRYILYNFAQQSPKISVTLAALAVGARVAGSKMTEVGALESPRIRAY